MAARVFGSWKRADRTVRSQESVGCLLTKVCLHWNRKQLRAVEIAGIDLFEYLSKTKPEMDSRHYCTIINRVFSLLPKLVLCLLSTSSQLLLWRCLLCHLSFSFSISTEGLTYKLYTIFNGSLGSISQPYRKWKKL